MKWTIPELKRKQYTDNHFHTTLDLNQYITQGSDIISIDPVIVTGHYYFENNEYVHFDMTIDTLITMACARTLVPIDIPIHINTHESFSETPHEEYHQVEGITVDLSPIVWSNIYLEKPIRVVHPDSTFVDDVSAKVEENINPLFKDLEKYKR